MAKASPQKTPALPIIQVDVLDAQAAPEQLEPNCLTLKTTLNVLLPPNGFAEAPCGVVLRFPDGYMPILKEAREDLRVLWLRSFDDAEAVLYIQNTTPHFTDVSPGDVLAHVRIVPVQPFEIAWLPAIINDDERKEK